MGSQCAHAETSRSDREIACMHSPIPLTCLAGGHADWKKVCGEFWQPLSAAAQSTADISVRDVIDVLDAVLEPHLFPTAVRLPLGDAVQAATMSTLGTPACFGST